jgi:outer membrane lipoprotein
MFFQRIATALSGGVLAVAACSPPYGVVPPALESQVDQSVTFSQLKESPDSYRGRLVVLGGEVLSAKRLKEGTRIEVLQLPLTNSQEPVGERTASEGRFLAFQKDFLDPAKYPPGTRVTITGEVTGARTQALDETEYTYPTLEIKNVNVWPRIIDGGRLPRQYYWAPYWGWGGRGYYPYWW